MCPKLYEMVGARSRKCCGIYFPSKKAVDRHKKIHAPGGILVIQPLHPNGVDSEDDEENDSNDRLQDPADDGIPIITDIIEFLDYPWKEEIGIQILCSMYGEGWRVCIKTCGCVFTSRESQFSIFCVRN